MNLERQADVASVEAYLLERFGFLLGGSALWKAMGFNSSQAFRKAAARGDVPVRTFHIERRRGLFAYSSEVAQWLDTLADRKRETNTH